MPHVTENPIKELEKVYNDFAKRINPENWLKILTNDNYVNDVNKTEINYELISFLTKNSNIPAKVYECLGNFFNWNEHRAEMAEIFPLSVIDDLCNKMYSNSDIDYNMLPLNFGRKTDSFIKLYTSAHDKIMYDQIYKAQKDIDAANAIYGDYLPLELLSVSCMRVKGDYEGALKKIEYIKSKYGQHENIFLDEGTIYLMMGRLNEAYDAFKSGIKINPNSYALNNKLGECCMNLGLYEQSRQIYLDLSYSHPYIDEISTNYLSANCFIVDMYEGKSDLSYEQSLCLSQSYLYVSRIDDSYNTACSIKEKMQTDIKGCLVMGHILRNMKKYGEALSWYESAIRMNSTECFGYYFLAKTYLALGQSQEAIKNYEKSIEINKDYYLPYYSLAKLYIQDGQFEKAEYLLAELSKQNFDLANVYYLRGLLSEEKENYENSLTFYDKSIETCRSEITTYLSKSRVLRFMKRYREAMSTCDQALDYGFKDTTLYLEKGLIYKESEMYEDALYWFDVSIDEENPNAEIYFLKGLCLYQKEAFDEADECFDKAISIDKIYEQKVREIVDKE